MNTYLQKTNDILLFNNISITDRGEMQIATKLVEAVEILKKDGAVRLNKLINVDELKSIREYVRFAMYKGNLTDTVVIDKHKHILFAPGRQDMWTIDLPLTIPKLIEDILDASMATEYKKASTGALPLDANTLHTGKWHRDTIPLFKIGTALDNDIFTRNLPDFYFTVFIPLTLCTIESGATEMLLGSHNSDKKTLAYALASPGDVIIMNGKLIHRSVPNKSDNDRDLLYVIYCAKWYDEEKF